MSRQLRLFGHVSWRARLLSLLGVVFVLACGGNGGAVDPPTVITTQRLAFLDVPTTDEAGDTLTVAVTLTTTTRSLVTSAENPSGVVVQSSNPAIASVIGPAGVAARAPWLITALSSGGRRHLNPQSLASEMASKATAHTGLATNAPR